MSALSKRDAMKLVADIRNANVTGHAVAARTNGDYVAATYGFLGGLEAVLHSFLLQQGCFEAAAALQAAMNDTPTATEVAGRNAKIASYRSQAAGGAA